MSLKRIHKHLVAMRYAINVPAAMLVFVSFGLAGGNLAHAAIIGLLQFIILGATMVINDLVDAEVDHTTGRRSFAYDEPEHFRKFCICLWSLSLAGSISLVLVDWRSALLALVLCFDGYIYSSTRRILGLPAFIVGFTIALSACFPLLHAWSEPVALLAAVACLGIIAREIAGKDVEDRAGDMLTCWKRTIAGTYGAQVAAIAGCIMLAVSVLILFCLPLSQLPTAAAWAGAFAAALVSFSAFTYGSTTASKGKLVFDAGMALLMTTATACYVTGRIQSAGTISASAWHIAGLTILVLFAGFWAVSIWEKKEQLEVNTTPSPFGEYGIWALMTILMGVIVYGLRLLACGTPSLFLCQSRYLYLQWLIDSQTRNAGEIAVAGVLGLLLLLVVNMAIDWNAGYRIIATMAAGLAFGAFAVAMDIAGLPAVVTMIVIPLAALIYGAESRLTTVTKNRAFHLGVGLSVSIVLGPWYAVTSFLTAYLIVVIIYYARALQQGVSVIPRPSPLREMSR